MFTLLFASIFAVAQLTTGKELCLRQLRKDIKDVSGADISIGSYFIEHVNTADYSFEIENPNTPLQHVKKLQKLTIEQRKKAASGLYYAMVGECKEQDLSCKICDLLFIAKELVMGDPKCYFTCSDVQTIENADNLPTSKTLETYFTIGMDISKKSDSNAEFMAIINKGREAADLEPYGSSKKKAVFLFPVVVIAMKAVIGVCSLQAINYAANMAQKNKHQTGQAVKLIGQVHKVAAAGGGCFSASSIVRVQVSPNNIVDKVLKDIQVGDLVESINPETGRPVFTRVYYMAPHPSDFKSNLLRVHYQGDSRDDYVELSGRHLIYITKKNQAAPTAPTEEPSRADLIEIGDWVWVRKGDSLQAKRVVDIIPVVTEVRHPLTDNHRIVVNGVHSSVHILNERLYRFLTAPLRFTYWLNPSWNQSKIVNKLVRFVESVKEPFFDQALGKAFAQLISSESAVY